MFIEKFQLKKQQFFEKKLIIVYQFLVIKDDCIQAIYFVKVKDQILLSSKYKKPHMSPQKNNKYSPTKTPKSPMKNSKFAQDIQCVIHSSNQAYGSLYISNIEAAQNIHTIRKYKIKSIISCARGYQAIHSQQDVHYYKYFPAIDNQNCNISVYFDQAADFIAQTIQKTNVLVHCIAGVSRSPSLVLAYLIKYKGTTLEKAYKYLLGKRRIIYPNNSFINQLTNYQKALAIQFRSRSMDLNKSEPRLQRFEKSEQKKFTQSFFIKSPKNSQKKMHTESPSKELNITISHSPSQKDKIKTRYQNRYNISPIKPSLHVNLSKQIDKSIQILNKKRNVQKSPRYINSLSNFYQLGKDYRIQQSPLRYSSRYYDNWRYPSSYITGQRTKYYDTLYNRLRAKDPYHIQGLRSDSPSRR